MLLVAQAVGLPLQNMNFSGKPRVPIAGNGASRRKKETTSPQSVYVLAARLSILSGPAPEICSLAGTNCTFIDH